jgi:WD40 repeat protein
MRNTLVLLISVTVLVAGTMEKDQLRGVDIQIGPSGIRYVTEPSGSHSEISAQTHFFGNMRAEVIWVDRNHQNAIARHTAISRDGLWIQAGWYLNNERTSLYQTQGTGLPEWNYPMPNAEFTISVDVSANGNDIAAIAQGTPCYSFAPDSGTPNWTYTLPTGFTFVSSDHGPTVCVSDDGTLYAALARQDTDARIFVLDDSGDTVRTIAFDPNTNVYGLDMASDGSVFCVSTYNVIYVFNADGSRRDSIPQYGQTVAKISADGKYLVKGDFNTRTVLHRWNGSSYELAWQYYTGHPWVTAVAISDDASTIMAGTYRSSPTYAGKVLLFDSSSATPLWQYAQYGDYVASCALSEYGSIGVAGSWGQYNATYGDVLTLFERGSATPIFQLLDDIDEPGSIFSVGISSDGSRVCAGGKAVHAREFGNGGEVYAINAEVGITEYGSALPVQLAISAPAPNPFTTDILLRFSVPRAGRVSINVYDITGRIVTTLVNGILESGTHEIAWQATDDKERPINSGIYFLRVNYENENLTRKVTLISE